MPVYTQGEHRTVRFAAAVAVDVISAEKIDVLPETDFLLTYIAGSVTIFDSADKLLCLLF